MQETCTLSEYPSSLAAFFSMLDDIDKVSPAQRKWLMLILKDLGTTPEITSDDEYRHYFGQLTEMNERYDKQSRPQTMAMSYALFLRLLEYGHLVGKRAP